MVRPPVLVHSRPGHPSRAAGRRWRDRHLSVDSGRGGWSVLRVSTCRTPARPRWTAAHSCSRGALVLHRPRRQLPGHRPVDSHAATRAPIRMAECRRAAQRQLQAGEMHLAADGSWMVFHRDGGPGTGRDLWIDPPPPGWLVRTHRLASVNTHETRLAYSRRMAPNVVPRWYQGAPPLPGTMGRHRLGPAQLVISDFAGERTLDPAETCLRPPFRRGWAIDRVRPVHRFRSVP